jgi:hypothetical protein
MNSSSHIDRLLPNDENPHIDEIYFADEQKSRGCTQGATEGCLPLHRDMTAAREKHGDRE